MVAGWACRCLAGMVAAGLLVALPAACRRGEDPGQAARERREAAYRATNRGVGLLEQFAYDRAAAAFEEALRIDPGVRLARVNLAIAVFYAGRTNEAATHARTAQEDYPDAPEPAYLLGLIARAGNQPEEAIRQFQRVLRVDTGDAGARTNLAMVLLDLRRHADAAAMAASALAVEPYNATAAYTRGLALTRLGHPDASRAMQQFDQLRMAPYAITYAQAYLEQGRYAEAVASSGAEPGLVSAALPPVTFADATAEWLPPGAGAPAADTPGAVALVDLDNDGDLDLLAGGATLRILRNDRPKFADITATALPAPVAEVRGIVGGDLTDDGRTDLVVLTAAGPRLLIQGMDGRLRVAPLPDGAAGEDVRTAALADVDHDGDLDVFLGSGTGRLLRNNGNGSFADITGPAGLRDAAAGIAVVPTDFDNRRDIDLVTVTRGRAVMVFRNLRTGAFADVGPAVGAPGPADYAALAVGDVNKDGFTDLFLGREAAGGIWALSERSGRYRATDAPASTRGTRGAQLIDYDNDGLLDLLAMTTDGPRLFRNVGEQWQEHADALRPATALLPTPAAITALASGDLDLDGDTDVAVAIGGSVRIWRNDGGSRSRAVQVTLTGRVSNRAGVGAKVEVRAGSLYQRIETAAATPPVAPADVLVGLGPRAAADVIRVLWPSGVLQAEIPAVSATAGATRMALTELDRKPSSCPYLYTWNGERFEFVTDFMGGGEMGYLHTPPDGRNVPDPDEYIRITDRQLRERGDRLELRVTNELEEVLFMDHLALGVVAHPADTEVFPDEGMRQRLRPFQTYTVRAAQPPAAAVDEHGHDVLPRIARRDHQFVDDFALAPVRGYAGEHALVVDLRQIPPRAANERTVLLLTGWTDYAFSSDNVRAHQAGLTLAAPVLQVETPGRVWQTVDADAGVPVGRPQTLVLDVTRYAPRRVRLVTSMRIYWDEVLVGTGVRDTPALTPVPLRSAELRWRGFSEPIMIGGQPLSYDYHSVSQTTPWKLMPGRYTREGDVRELLAGPDDRFVISRPGDELVLSFDASALAPLGPGMRRTYVLYTVGFSKEMDLHSASPDVVVPMPFRHMTKYPFTWPERYPHEQDMERFHTRVVPRGIGTLLPEITP